MLQTGPCHVSCGGPLFGGELASKAFGMWHWPMTWTQCNQLEGVDTGQPLTEVWLWLYWKFLWGVNNNSLLSPWQAPAIAPMFLNVLLSGPFCAWSWPGKHGAACLWTHPHPRISSARISCFLSFLPICSLTQFSCLFWFCTVQRSGSPARRWQGRKPLVTYWDVLLKCITNYSSFQKHV